MDTCARFTSSIEIYLLGKRLVAQLKNLGVNIKHENHQLIVNSVRKVKVDDTGIVQN